MEKQNLSARQCVDLEREMAPQKTMILKSESFLFVDFERQIPQKRISTWSRIKFWEGQDARS